MTESRSEQTDRVSQVEILYFDGCPNYDPVVALVERVGAELGLEPRIRLVEVADAEEAAELRFLGSPTVRVDGRDVEPGAGARVDYALCCRVFRTAAGMRGEPDEQWVRKALLHDVSANAEPDPGSA